MVWILLKCYKIVEFSPVSKFYIFETSEIFLDAPWNVLKTQWPPAISWTRLSDDPLKFRPKLFTGGLKFPKLRETKLSKISRVYVWYIFSICSGSLLYNGQGQVNNCLHLFVFRDCKQ